MFILFGIKRMNELNLDNTDFLYFLRFVAKDIGR